MLKKVLSGGLALLCSWPRLHVSARIVTGQHQRLGPDLGRYTRVTLPVTITASAAAPGVPIAGLGGMFKRP